MQQENILDKLKCLDIKGINFYRKKADMCIILSVGCKYYIHDLGDGIVRIASSKELDRPYLTTKNKTKKYFQYECKIDDIMEDKSYHISKLQDFSDGFGVLPTEDGIFKDYVTKCIKLILPALKEILQIEDIQ